MKIREIIVEYRRDETLTRLGNKLIPAAKQDRNQSVDEVISQLEDMDPSVNKQYVPWLAVQYIKGQFRTEDSGRVTDLLQNFDKLKPRLPTNDRDINKFDFYKLDEKIDAILNPELNTKATPVEGNFPVVPNSKVLYNGPLGQLAVPETEEASCELGRGTKWCTAADKDNAFENYRDAPLYVWRDRNGEKYQFYFGDGVQMMDSRDIPLSTEKVTYFRTHHPVLKKMFAFAEKDIAGDTYQAYNYAKTGIRGKFPEGEDAIAEDPMLAFKYAHDVIKGAFPKGERSIASNPDLAYNYAKYTLKGKRFPEGEPTIIRAITRSPEYAYSYATEVIRGRWPEAEEALESEDFYWAKYQKFLDSFRPKGAART